MEKVAFLEALKEQQDIERTKLKLEAEELLAKAEKLTNDCSREEQRLFELIRAKDLAKVLK